MDKQWLTAVVRVSHEIVACAVDVEVVDQTLEQRMRHRRQTNSRGAVATVKLEWAKTSQEPLTRAFLLFFNPLSANEPSFSNFVMSSICYISGLDPPTEMI